MHVNHGTPAAIDSCDDNDNSISDMRISGAGASTASECNHSDNCGGTGPEVLREDVREEAAGRQQDRDWQREVGCWRGAALGEPRARQVGGVGAAGVRSVVSLHRDRAALERLPTAHLGSRSARLKELPGGAMQAGCVERLGWWRAEGSWGGALQARRGFMAAVVRGLLEASIGWRRAQADRPRAAVAPLAATSAAASDSDSPPASALGSCPGKPYTSSLIGPSSLAPSLRLRPRKEQLCWFQVPRTPYPARAPIILSLRPPAHAHAPLCRPLSPARWLAASIATFRHRCLLAPPKRVSAASPRRPLGKKVPTPEHLLSNPHRQHPCQTARRSRLTRDRLSPACLLDVILGRRHRNLPNNTICPPGCPIAERTQSEKLNAI
ncbi:hypothetical protein PSPO01_04001 [Paraphaeosphaeria sporulosa]